MSTVEYIVPPSIMPLILSIFLGLFCFFIVKIVNYLNRIRDGNTDEP